MKNDLISVIIPTYNREKELKSTIKSILNQTYQNFEILVCDDASTDNSYKILQEFNDPRIFWIAAEENSGLPAVPRNKGLKKAKGKWIAFLDSDDIWEAEKLEKQLLVSKEKKVSAICTDAKIMQNNKITKNSYFNFDSDNIYSFNEMAKVNYVICSSILVKKSLIDKFDGFPEDKKFKAIEDYALWLAISTETNIYYINEPLTIYRDEPTLSIRGKVIDDENTKYRRILLETIRRIILNNPTKKDFILKITEILDK